MPEVSAAEIVQIAEAMAATTPGKLVVCTVVWLGFLKVLFPGTWTG